MTIDQAEGGESRKGFEDLEFARGLVQQAGDYVRTAVAGTYETAWKPDNTPVTTIDTEVNRIVIEEIQRAYPNDRVYGEEESSDGEGVVSDTWVLDPIDGTQALGLFDTYNICLAKLDADGRPLFSFILNPSRDQLLEAQRGGETTLNGEPVRVSERDGVKSSYVFFGSRLRFDDLASNGTAYDRLEGQGAKIANARSLAFGGAMVATGRAEGAYIGVSTPFEAASLELIVEGAGGRVTDLYGNPTGRMDGEIKGMLVSNGLIHDDLVRAIQP